MSEDNEQDLFDAANEEEADTDSDETIIASEEEVEGTELESFEAADIEDVEILTEEQVMSIVESALFSTDKPISVAVIKQAFKGTNVKSKEIREAIASLQQQCAETVRGFTLDEVAGGFQLRTKASNMKYLRQSVKARPFRLSGPALEVISIVAYKQPTTKAQIDEIRGVESGHLLRALMEKQLITFGERSDLPGKPMFYETTRKFLEIFGLRNLQELPSLHEIDQLIPEGIGEVEDKETLSDLTGQLSQEVGTTYSEGEDELLKITDELSTITTSSTFFEEEKVRLRDKRDAERAQDIREALAVGEPVEEKDQRWLERYETSKLEAAKGDEEVAFVTEGASDEMVETPSEEPAPEPNIEL
jgi:segregation and condensation protein B